MERRAFVIGGLAALASWRALAQRTQRVAILVHGTARSYARRFDALRAALKAHGYVEGRNLVFITRWNEGSLDRLPELAAELLRIGSSKIADELPGEATFWLHSKIPR